MDGLKKSQEAMGAVAVGVKKQVADTAADAKIDSTTETIQTPDRPCRERLDIYDGGIPIT
jgi:hypothetical protein